MKDIDFDELDRAVTSLLGKKTTDEAKAPEGPQAGMQQAKPAPIVQPAQQSQQAARGVMPEPGVASVPPTSSVSAPSKPAPQPSPPQPSSRPSTTAGSRFMDVVHPSSTSPKQSGMSAQSASPQSTPMASRASHAGKPLSPSPSPSQEQSARLNDALVPKSQANKAPASSSFAPKEEKQEKLLESHQQKQAKLAAHTGQARSSGSVTRVAEDVPSPILSDAKVEKRPLGGSRPPLPSRRNAGMVAPSSEMQASTDTEQGAMSPLEKQQDTPVAKDYGQTLPPELHQDVVAAEAGDPESDKVDRPDTPPAYPPEKEKTKSTAPRTAETARVAGQAATMSIPQQYRAKTDQPDTTTRSIYDTKEYHQPLSTPQPTKKKTHPAIWILLVVLLLVAGVAVGVGAYFLFG